MRLIFDVTFSVKFVSRLPLLLLVLSIYIRGFKEGLVAGDELATNG